MLRCCRLATIPVDRFGVRDDNAVDAAALGDAMSRFSDRYGYKGEKSPIIVREDAPAALREAVPTIAEDCGIDPRHLRRVVCHVLRRIPDPNNWSPHPNMWEEAVQHVQDCAWYRVYDICEALYDFLLTTRQDEDAAERLQTQLNDVFVEHGIGWQMAEGAMLARESEAIDSAVQAAEERLQETGSTTARDELREALRDLSRRPKPDVTGCVTHSTAALECLCRSLSGKRKATLGQIMKRHSRELGVPPPLDQAVSKLYGYASEVARHVREGEAPSRAEAALVLGVAASLIAYLASED